MKSQLTIITALLLSSCLQASALRAEIPLIEMGKPSREAVLRFRELHEGKQQRLRQDQSLRDSRTLEAYDVTFYDLDLVMMTGAESMTGTVDMTFTSLDDNLNSIDLHAGHNLTLSNVSVNDAPAGFGHGGNNLEITLPSHMNAGDSAVLHMEFTADIDGSQGVLPSSRTNVQTGQSIDILTTQAEPWDARYFWPCRDIPMDKADSLRARITTQDYNTVVSNGVMENNVDNNDGTRSVTWFEKWPMVTYLFSVCVAPYNHISDTWEWNEISMPMEEWSWGLSPTEQNWVTQTGMSALTALSERITPYPYHDEKYGHAQYTWGGAMEHQSVSSMGFYNQAVIAHELMHQWFGDKVTCATFNDIWLNEGWATYGESLFEEALGGADALHANMDIEEYYGPGTITVEDPESQTIFDGNLSYAKGSWVHHMLRHVLGDDDFFTAVANYLGGEDPASYRSVTTAEYQSFMEELYGSSLDWFFQEWIYGEYYPHYGYSWESVNTDEWVLHLNLVQLQVPERQTFTMPVDVALTYASGDTETITVFNNSAGQQFNLLVPEEVVALEIDPENWILSEVTDLSELPGDPQLNNSWLENSESEEIFQVPDNSTFIVALEILNAGSTLDDVLVSLSTEDEGIFIETMEHNTGELGTGEAAVVRILCNATGANSGNIIFTAELNWDLQNRFIDLVFPSAHSDMILVDDDGGDSFEQYYADAAADVAQLTIVSPEEFADITLDHTKLVIWAQGNHGADLDASTEATLETWVAGGGHLVLTGQNLCESQDSEWLEDFCGVSVTENNVSGSAVDGEDLAFFEDEILFFINGGAGNQNQMDRLQTSTAWPVLRHFGSADSGDAGAVMAQGAQGGEVLSLGFGLEGVSGTGSSMDLQDVLQRLLDWADGNVDVNENGFTQPQDLSIESVYPNPFNPSTTIRFSNLKTEMVELLVYNLAGQLVETLHKGRLTGGSHELTWHARGLSSGIYLLMLNSSRTQMTQKIVLLK